MGKILYFLSPAERAKRVAVNKRKQKSLTRKRQGRQCVKTEVNVQDVLRALVWCGYLEYPNENESVPLDVVEAALDKFLEAWAARWQHAIETGYVTEPWRWSSSY